MTRGEICESRSEVESQNFTDVDGEQSVWLPLDYPINANTDDQIQTIQRTDDLSELINAESFDELKNVDGERSVWLPLDDPSDRDTDEQIQTIQRTDDLSELNNAEIVDDFMHAVGEQSVCRPLDDPDYADTDEQIKTSQRTDELSELNNAESVDDLIDGVGEQSVCVPLDDPKHADTDIQKVSEPFARASHQITLRRNYYYYDSECSREDEFMSDCSDTEEAIDSEFDDDNAIDQSVTTTDKSGTSDGSYSERDSGTVTDIRIEHGQFLDIDEQENSNVEDGTLTVHGTEMMVDNNIEEQYGEFTEVVLRKNLPRGMEITPVSVIDGQFSDAEDDCEPHIPQDFQIPSVDEMLNLESSLDLNVFESVNL